ncbi:MAG: pseudouridine synthase [Lysobacterales bacterium]
MNQPKHPDNDKEFSPEKPQQKPQRLQKLMATAGLGSRRALERQIKSGKVLINNKPATLGQTASEGDQLRFEDREWKVVDVASSQRSLVYNKPLGEVTTRSDPQGRPTVFDHLPRIQGARWIAVGRLDLNTSGLLLMTTDGELAHAMMHPSNQVDREYACRIFGEVDADKLANLKKGVMLDDGMAQFSDIQAAGGDESNTWYHVTLLEGRNREVRRLWASQDLMVSRLKRVRYGAVFLPKRLRMGDWSELTAKDHQTLREDVGLGPVPVQLALKAEKVERQSDRRAIRKKMGPRKKSTRYKNVDHK